MAIAVVGELIVGSRELLEALVCYGIEIPAEFCVLRENDSSARNERVDQRLLAHFPLFLISIRADFFRVRREIWGFCLFLPEFTQTLSLSPFSLLFLRRERERENARGGKGKVYNDR